MQEYNAKAFDEYVGIVSRIASGGEGTIAPELLWFRGVSHREYDLIPSLYRGKELFDSSSDEIYTRRHYAEDLRVQHYTAKNYHTHEKMPVSRIEWLEVMQHNGMHTRLLDWSESAIHALLFSVEPFLNNDKYTNEDRRLSTPCVWVIHPQRINDRILFELLDFEEYGDVFKELDIDKDKYAKCLETMGIKKEKSGEMTVHHWNDSRSLQSIFNLGEVLKHFNPDTDSMMNAVFQFMVKVYGEGYPLKTHKLAPLAIVESYHSERIRSQRGVFTIWPHYKDAPNVNVLRKIGVEPDAMQKNSIASDFIYRINLNDPYRISYELISNGILYSWLYPEQPIVSGELENRRIYG